MRADQLLVDRGLASSRSQAVRLISGGLRWREGDAEWRDVAKNRDEVPDGAELELADAAEARYVSRGGLKLEGGLRAAGVAPRGMICLDVGQSTGGFTDCLLQHGAKHVVGVDVGQGQLHPTIRADGRVTAIEKVNARSLIATDLIAPGVDTAGGTATFVMGSPLAFDLVVADVSFISLTLLLPALVGLVKPGGAMLLLVKPQFELQPGQVGKGGVVRDVAMYGVVEQRLRAACGALGLQVLRWFDSPIAGGDGNKEFFIHAMAPQGAGD